MQEKICTLESSAEDIAQVYNSSLVDRTLGSAVAYLEAKDDLLPWMEDTQSKIFSFDPPAILSDDLITQQAEVDVSSLWDSCLNISDISLQYPWLIYLGKI